MNSYDYPGFKITDEVASQACIVNPPLDNEEEGVKEGVCVEAMSVRTRHEDEENDAG